MQSTRYYYKAYEIKFPPLRTILKLNPDNGAFQEGVLTHIPLIKPPLRPDCGSKLFKETKWKISFYDNLSEKTVSFWSRATGWGRMDCWEGVALNKNMYLAVEVVKYVQTRVGGWEAARITSKSCWLRPTKAGEKTRWPRWEIRMMKAAWMKDL